MVEGKHERRGSMIVPLQGSKDHGAPGGAGAMDTTASTVANRAFILIGQSLEFGEVIAIANHLFRLVA